MFLDVSLEIRHLRFRTTTEGRSAVLVTGFAIQPFHTLHDLARSLVFVSLRNEICRLQVGKLEYACAQTSWLLLPIL